LLDPEVWEHSSDYKPPPASAVTTISPPLSVSASALRTADAIAAAEPYSSAVRAASVAVTVSASFTPVVSPIADDEAVGFVPSAPTIIPATGGPAAAPPLCRQYAGAAAPERTVYVSIRWADRKFCVLDPEDEDEFSSASCLCTADALSEEITNDRLLAFYRLEKRLEALQERYDHERSYLDSAPDPDEFRGRGIDRAERLYLANRYEAALQEEAHLEDTLGHELRVCDAEYKAAKEALVFDIFGPAPVYAPDNTVYFTLASDGSIDEICGTGKSILECVPPRAEAHEYFHGLYTTLTADLPPAVTNARLLEVWEAPAADKPELWAALLADSAK
jgi:hypothetical protein